MKRTPPYGLRSRVERLPAEGGRDAFAISLDDWNNPLVAALGRPHTFFALARAWANQG